VQHGADENTAYDGVPEIGVITNKDIDLEEMAPHYFVPNFARPMPEAEEDPDLDAPEGILEHDISEDVSDSFSPNFRSIIGDVLDPWHAPRTILGFQYGDGIIQLRVNEEVLE